MLLLNKREIGRFCWFPCALLKDLTRMLVCFVVRELAYMNEPIAYQEVKPTFSLGLESWQVK